MNSEFKYQVSESEIMKWEEIKDIYNKFVSFFKTGLDEKVLEGLHPTITALLQHSLVIDPRKRATFAELMEIININENKFKISSQPLLVKPILRKRVVSGKLLPTYRKITGRPTTSLKTSVKPSTFIKC